MATRQRIFVLAESASGERSWAEAVTGMAEAEHMAGRVRDNDGIAHIALGSVVNDDVRPNGGASAMAAELARHSAAKLRGTRKRK